MLKLKLNYLSADARGYAARKRQAGGQVIFIYNLFMLV